MCVPRETSHCILWVGILVIYIFVPVLLSFAIWNINLDSVLWWCLSYYCYIYIFKDLSIVFPTTIHQDDELVHGLSKCQIIQLHCESLHCPYFQWNYRVKNKCSKWKRLIKWSCLALFQCRVVCCLLYNFRLRVGGYFFLLLLWWFLFGLGFFFLLFVWCTLILKGLNFPFPFRDCSTA